MGATLAVGGCFVSERFDVEELHLTLADASQPVFARVYLASKLDYFAEEALAVDFVSFTSGRDALASVIHGEADIATVLETPVVRHVQEGVALSVISSLHHSIQNTARVARKDRGISLPEDLPSLLSSGTVDAVATWNPNVYLSQRAMAEGQVSTFYSDVYTEMSMLMGMREFVAEHKEHIQRLVHGIVRAEDFYRRYPDRSLEIVIEHLSEVSEESIRSVWQRFKAEAKLSNVLLTILRQEGDWFRRAGLASGPARDFREVIVTEFLAAEKPQAVTIF